MSAIPDSQPLPHATAEQNERRDHIHVAIAALPEAERVVVVLFYISEYSREEIAGFLDITPLAVKKRLASARRRLKERMIPMFQEELHEQRPSRDADFAGRVLAFSRQFGDLLRSGTPILKTLEMCAAAQPDSERFQDSISEMKDQVKQGLRLRDAMERYPDLFNRHYIEAVSFGEEHGSLDIVLERLARGESFETGEQLAAFKNEMADRHQAQQELPRTMALFPHLFREGDLQAMAIGEETGTVDHVVRRLTGGVEYDSADKITALREEMTALGKWLREAK